MSLAAAATGPMRLWVIAGLAWSLGGDIALMLPGDYFVAGLALFLVAHLCYIVAFTRDGWRATPGPALVVGAYLMLVATLLLPSLGAMRAPVVVYAAVISLMVWQALERAAALHTPAARLTAFGAVMFIVSDSALGVNRFLMPIPFERWLVMGTYALAQCAIALGARRAGGAPAPARLRTRYPNNDPCNGPSSAVDVCGVAPSNDARCSGPMTRAPSVDRLNVPCCAGGRVAGSVDKA